MFLPTVAEDGNEEVFRGRLVRVELIGGCGLLNSP